MGPDAARRYLRQIALPEIGPDGQQRLGAAVIAVAEPGDGEGDLAAEVAARYLAAAGVGTVRLIGGVRSSSAGAGASASAASAPAASPYASALRASNPDVVVEHRGWPADGAAWVAALDGADLIVRAGFDDDPMLRASVRLGIPALLLRALDDRAELIAFRRQGPCPHVDLEIPPRRAEAASNGAGAVVAGTLGAAEALLMLVGRAGDGELGASRARHLALPLDGGAPRVQEIPWSPECFACGGGAVEMVFS